jgi:FkbM family methyltransferase
MKRDFFSELYKKIILSVNNEFQDNFDFARYDSVTPNSGLDLKIFVKKMARRFRFFKNEYLFEKYLNNIEDNYDTYSGYKYLYDLLIEESDKSLLIDIVLYRLMGNEKIKLPLNNNDYLSNFKKVVNLRTNAYQFESLNKALSLYKHNLGDIGFPIEMILSSYGVLIDFVHEQYRYNNNETEIRVNLDDFVIDGGGCYGDTALYFSYLTGKNGKVFSFEFVPSSLDIFRENLSLNNDFSSNIIIEEKPLLNESGKKIYYSDNGPATKVSEFQFDSNNSVTDSISIDDFVKKNKLSKVDFIKLDIEGSEFAALVSASETIKKFKPKLAIALYHSPLDFERIPKLLKEYLPSYKFYLKHATINHEETMLFAMA